MFLARCVFLIALVLVMAPVRGLASADVHAEKSHHEEKPHHEATKVEAPKKQGALEILWRGFLTKLERMKNLDQQNEALRQRTAELEIENARIASRYAECRDEKRVVAIKREAKREGGVETARTIASLQTHDQAMLTKPPKAIFDEAMKAFNAGDYETAAKALGFLAEHPENDSYKNAATFYLAGVSLFKVGNYKAARAYFEHALKYSTGDEIVYAPRSMGWIALCHAKLGDKAAEKTVVRELIQKYPKSKEARRLNRHA